MSWLIHNPIGDMPGPLFLGVYFVVVAVTCIASYRSLKARDVTGWLEPPPVPTKLDPYEAAYLRAGENEVIRVVLFSLIGRGYVEIFEEKSGRFSPKVKKLRQTIDRPDESELTSLERMIDDAVATPIVPTTLFEKNRLRNRVAEACSLYKKELEAEELLRPPGMISAAWSTFGGGAMVLTGLAGYKLLVATVKGRDNVGLLISLCFFGLFALAITLTVRANRRLSERGRAYLERLKLAFADLKDPAKSTANAAGYDGATALMIGLYGLATLKGTPYSSYADMFPQAAAAGACGGGGCGGGCGGGGCGGGCGGCGG